MRAKALIDAHVDEEMEEFRERTPREGFETATNAIPRTTGGPWSYLRANTVVYGNDDEEMDEFRGRTFREVPETC